MRLFSLFLLTLACAGPKDPATTDPDDSEPTDSDRLESDEPTVDTERAPVDTEVEEPPGPVNVLTTGFETPGTPDFTSAGWEGFSTVADHASAGVVASGSPGVTPPVGSQVGYLQLSPGGGSAASIALRTTGGWTVDLPGRSMEIVVLAASRSGFSLPLNGVSLTLYAGDTSRASAVKGIGDFTGSGNFSPLVLQYTTTEADVGQTLQIEIASNAACCAGPLQVMFDELTWTVAGL